MRRRCDVSTDDKQTVYYEIRGAIIDPTPWTVTRRRWFVNELRPRVRRARSVGVELNFWSIGKTRAATLFVNLWGIAWWPTIGRESYTVEV